MPIRNFWIEANIDGRKTKLTGGPQRKDGGLKLKIYVKERGKSIIALTIECTKDSGKNRAGGECLLIHVEGRDFIDGYDVIDTDLSTFHRSFETK